MKKSECYRAVIGLVFDADLIEFEDKIEIVRVLLSDFDLAEFAEKQSEEQKSEWLAEQEVSQ